MPITADDLKFFASETMSDLGTAGGPRGGTVVQDGVENTIFPDFSGADRLSGRAQIRKVYPSVVSASSDTLYGARCTLHEVPTDPAVSVVAYQYGDAVTTRATLIANAFPSPLGKAIVFGSGSYSELQQCTVTGGVASIPATLTSPTWLVAVGDTISLKTAAGVTTLHVATSTAGTNPHTVGLVPTPADGSYLFRGLIPQGRCVAPVATTATAAAAATAVPLATLWARVVPVNPTSPYPTAELSTGVGSGWASFTHGQVRCLDVGDTATIWHEASVAPTTVANTDVVSTGRTNLSELVVFGNDGGVIARFLANGPTVSGAGCSADLAAGTVTFSDVTGYSQPVTVRHRIAESVGIVSFTGLTANLVSGLSREFPAGSMFCAEIQLGDLEAGSSTLFSQQAWTRVWSDAVIGSSAPVLYTGSIGIVLAGADTDRWACIFTTASIFELHSERRGKIASGNTGSDFSPVNPDTGEPFFTLYSAGWASPAVGNVFRFNTSGPYAPVWLIRSVYPSAASGLDGAALRLRGDVNA